MRRRIRRELTGVRYPSCNPCWVLSRCLTQSPFERNFPRRKGDCVKHLLNTQHGLQEGYLTPVSSRRILLRMCANLHQTYANLEMVDEASRVQRYLVALAK